MHSITKKILLALVISCFFVLSFIFITSYLIQRNNEANNWQQIQESIKIQASVIFREPVFSYDAIFLLVM
jgi:hypothetical protein